MEFQSSMSAMEMEVRTSTATHKLDGISEEHVSNGNGGQNINSNSHAGWNFRAACQQWKWRSEHQQQLTPWMEFQSSMLAMRSEHQQQLTNWMEFQRSMLVMEMEVRTSTATHSLDEISEQHVSNGNGGQKINSNSQSRWNFRAACQQWKWRSEHQQQLTPWIEFQGSMLTMRSEHQQQLTRWMEFQSSM